MNHTEDAEPGLCGLSPPRETRAEQCGSDNQSAWTGLVGWTRQQRREIEEAVDWATNRVWAEWFRREQRGRMRPGSAGRPTVRCRDCPTRRDRPAPDALSGTWK